MAELSLEDIQRARDALASGSLSAQQEQRLRSILTEALGEKPASSPIAPTGPARTLTEATRGFVTPGAFEAIGGTVGAAAATPAAVAAGPAAPLVLLGAGAAGAAGGRLAFNTVEDFLRFLGTLPQRDEPRTIPGQLTEAGQAAREDVLFGGGMMALGGVAGTVKPMIGRILGVRGPEADAVVAAAERSGLPVGAIDIAPGITGRIMRGASDVLGIFPFIGGPIRKQARIKGETTVSKTDELLNRMAPNAIFADDLAIDMVEAARGSSQEFRRVAGELYDNFRALAEAATVKEIIPTEKVVAKVNDFVSRQRAGAITLADGEVLRGPTADAFEEFLVQIEKLPERISLEQYRRLGDDLERFIAKATTDGYDIKRVVQIKRAMEEGLSDLRVDLLPRGEGEAILNALERANRFYADGIVRFRTPTAKRFERVDKKIFEPGAETPGFLNDDEILRVAVNLKSPQAIRDLRSLVGDDVMKRIARKHFDDAWSKAQVLDEEGVLKGFNWDAFAKEVGLARPRGGERAALNELLSSTGVSIDEIADLVKVASRMKVPKEVNKFIARRATLGGLRGAAKGATAAGLIGDTMLSSFGAALVLRYGASLISSPAHLKAMRRVLSPDIPANLKRQLLGRVIENAAQAAGGVEPEE